MVVDYRLEDFLARDPSGVITDVRPGYFDGDPHRSLPTSLADPADPAGDPDVDWSPAFHRAIAAIRAIPMARGPYAIGRFAPTRIRLDTRWVWRFYSALRVTCPTEIRGDYCVKTASGTRLRFYGCPGIELTREPVVPGAPPDYHVGRAHLSGLSLEYVRPSGAAPDPSHHGFTVRWMSDGENLAAAGFDGYGLLLEASVYDALPSSASLSEYEKLGMHYNGRSGIRVHGHDANNCVFSVFDCSMNGQLWLPDDCYGVHDTSQLGVEFRFGHTRNNRICGYRMGKYLGVSPNQSTLYQCYSEHSAVGDPEHFQEGPSVIDGNCRVVSSILGSPTGRTIVSSGPGVPRGISDSVSQGAREHSGASKYGRDAGIVTTIGAEPQAQVPSGTTSVRLSADWTTDAYGPSGADAARTFFVHDSWPEARAFGFKPSPARGAFALGVTDRTHRRPHAALAQNGLVVGGGASAVAVLGSHDPRYEVATDVPPAVSAAASLRGKYPPAAALVGDVVLNARPSATHPWAYWQCGLLPDGVTKDWFRGPARGDVVPVDEP